MFKAAYAKRRCLVPVNGFFEWKAIKGQKAKQPYAIAMKDDSSFCLAGIWENWKHPQTGEWLRTFCIITTTANEGQSPTGDGDHHAGPWVDVEIKDNGTGIPAVDREKIFEPFFTTKPIGRGTGLGLSIAYGAVKSHGGSISVESEPGDGTAVRVRLPVHPPKAREAPV